MDIVKLICELREELARIDSVIAALERFARGVSETGGGSTPAKSRRGRKSMPEEERKMVSERMRKYWEKRRKQRV
jgi:hypothetical protein